MTPGVARCRCALPAFICCLAVELFSYAAPRPQVAEVPYLTGRITDNAEIFSPDTRELLTAMLKAHEDATANQIAILTMPSLENGSIEEFAARVFESWKLGQPGQDNGVLVIVSPGDRRIRIEVGQGLKERITEVAAGRIVRDLMTTAFNQGDYGRGMEDGLRAITSLLEGREPPQAASVETGQNKEVSFFEGADIPLTERILLGAFIFGIIGLFTIIGVLTPGVGWFLYLFLIPFWAMFPIVVVGPGGTLIVLGAYLIGYPAAKLILSRSDWYRKAKGDLQSKGVAQIGGFTLRSKPGSGPWSSARRLPP